MKDFGFEVRPALDVNKFLEDSVLVLDDVDLNSPFDLVALLLNRMKFSDALMEEAKLLLFTHDTGNHEAFFARFSLIMNCNKKYPPLPGLYKQLTATRIQPAVLSTTSRGCALCKKISNCVIS